MEPEKLSLKELLVRLPIGHLWGLIGVIAGLIVGASWIGWWFRGTIEEAKVGQVRQQEERANFLTVYLRYIMARDGLDQSISLDVARQALDDYIEERVEREGVTIHKGQGRFATVGLPDGSIWPIPPELSATSVPPR